MGVFEPTEVELFWALEFIAEQAQKGYGPFDALIAETELAAW